MSVTDAQDGAASGATVTLDAGLWASFNNARNDATFLTSWLSLLLTKVPGATLGVVMEADMSQGVFAPAAVAPDPRRDLNHFQPVLEKVISSGRPAALPSETGNRMCCAYPVRVGDQPVSRVVVVELVSEDPSASQLAIREMHWASGWLVKQSWSQLADEREAQLSRAAVALDLQSLTAEHRRPEAAAMAVVNELVEVLSADRVAVGMVVRRSTAPQIRLMALSNSAWFRKRSKLAERLETAMEETFDQNTTVAVPPLPSTERAIAVAHRDHIAGSQTSRVLSTPLLDQNGPVGTLMVERRGDIPFEETDRLLLESVAGLVGPMLELKRQNRRWVGGRIVDTVGHAAGVVLGPRRLSWKLLAVVLIGLGVAAATVQGPFRVTADAVLRGTVVRAAVAPFNGFIESARVRAGDVVSKGEQLATLDSADLKLERLRWQSERDRLEAQQRDALAKSDRSEVAFLEAQIAQAQAQLELAQIQLDRTRITSPIEGLVVSGDLSQTLGAPVQPGEVLFELAPLDAFRVDVHVDERDMRYVSDNGSGYLILTGRPSDKYSFTLTRITPVSEVREGANTFLVEAELDEAPPDLRPGMKGVAKIDAGRDLMVWIWSRSLIDWLRETAWTWQP